MFEWLKKASSTVPIKLRGLFGSNKIQPLSSTYSFLKLYSQDPYIHRSVDLIGSVAALADKYLIDKEGNKIRNHSILDLLQNPNDEGSFYFFKGAVLYIALGGETFWEVVTPQKVKLPQELYNIRPDRIKIIPDENKKKVTGYEFSVSGMSEPLTFNKEELIHIKTFNPTSDWRGLPSVEPLKEIVNADRYGWKWIQNFLKKEGIPKGFLTSEKNVNEPSINRIRKHWSQTESSDGVPFLPGNLDWEDLARPPKEAGMVDLIKQITNTKLATVGVPPALLGLTDSFDDVDVQLKMFYSLTVTPHLKRIEDRINSKLLPKYPNTEGLEFKFDTEPSGLMDFEILIDTLSSQFDRAALTPNEFVKETGIGDTYENGDEHFIRNRTNETTESAEINGN